VFLIREPIRFYCPLDEDHFFAWLHDIPAVKGVDGTVAGLELDIEEPIDKTSLYELIGLLTRYDVDRRCLRPLVESNPDPWFRDPGRYWHQSVFGE